MELLIIKLLVHISLNSDKYKKFLVEMLPILLEDVSLDVWQALRYQYDGCPAHSRAITIILNRKFRNRWIGRIENHKWPPRSPDLIPLDFFLWGKLKADVYHNALTTKDMRERIQRACGAIDHTSMCNTIWVNVLDNVLP